MNLANRQMQYSQLPIFMPHEYGHFRKIRPKKWPYSYKIGRIRHQLFTIIL
jgi:hypothetical protein